MSNVRSHEVTTDYGVMRFTSDDNVGYWWEQITGEVGMEMQLHQQRVIDEKAELDEKLVKLGAFISSSSVFLSLPEDEQLRLKTQAMHMSSYSKVLGERIAAFPVA